MSPKTSRTILVVEDEPMILEAVVARLAAEGYDVHKATDGPSAETTFGEVQPDLVVLDVMLPGFDGLEVCRRIQAQRPVPVLMLTARDDETDILIGLAVGADDYLTKPFSMKELVARCAALLRRVERAALLVHNAAPQVREFGDLSIDLAARRAFLAGVEVKLTSTEFELTELLSSRPGEVVARDELMTEIWDWANARGTRTLDSHIKALRAKIGSGRIRTSHGVGYAWEQTQ
jgi:DNA-binding response OmpR family regulator